MGLNAWVYVGLTVSEERKEALSSDLQDVEARARIEKLELEKGVLRRQLSSKFLWLEWAKALAGPVAILGLLWTIFVGYKQLNQAMWSRDEERFDKAISRLGSTNSLERLTGLAGLKLFLEPSQKGRQEATLNFLINVLAAEKEPTVRSAMLDILSKVTPSNVGQVTLDHTLVALRDRNRSLWKYQSEKFMARIKIDPKAGLEVGRDETPIGNASEEDMGPLHATAVALASLVRNGGKSLDLSGIYCVECNFSGEGVDLSGAKFDSAYLRDANFSNTILRGASFDSADLVHTNFTSSDLSGAKLTDSHMFYPVVQSALTRGGLWYALEPDFSCADLSNVDFSGSVLFGIYRNKPNSFMAAYPLLGLANLAGANLSNVKLFTAVPVSSVPTTSSDLSEAVQNVGKVLPFEYPSEEGSYNILVPNWENEKNIITVVGTGSRFSIKEPVLPEFWPSMVMVFNYLASARNLSGAQLPPGFTEFLARHRDFFSRGLQRPACKLIGNGGTVSHGSHLEKHMILTGIWNFLENVLASLVAAAIVALLVYRVYVRSASHLKRHRLFAKDLWWLPGWNCWRFVVRNMEGKANLREIEYQCWLREIVPAKAGSSVKSFRDTELTAGRRILLPGGQDLPVLCFRFAERDGNLLLAHTDKFGVLLGEFELTGGSKWELKVEYFLETDSSMHLPHRVRRVLTIPEMAGGKDGEVNCFRRLLGRQNDQECTVPLVFTAAEQVSTGHL